jgi:hypothetical protein
MNKRTIQEIRLEEDGIQIAYYTPDEDVRQPGVVQLHTLLIPRGGDWDDEIDTVLEAAEYLINDVLDDWSTLTPVDRKTARAEMLAAANPTAPREDD